MVYSLKDFDYSLPKEKIAKYPPRVRGKAKLLVIDRKSGKFEDKNYEDFIDYLNPGDVVVLNKTKVIKSRIFAKKESGKDIEIFFQKELGEKNGNFIFEALIGGRVGKEKKLKFQDKFFEIIKKVETSLFKVSFSGNKKEFFNLLDKFGKVPIPKYLERKVEKVDEKRYQTVFGKINGSIASPTASLNITKKTLERLEEKDVVISFVNLDIGWDTFKPVTEEKIDEHKIHSETFFIDEKASNEINSAKISGKKILAVGTTVMRVLESVSDESGLVKPFSGKTSIFIYPPYRFKVANMMITNFHAPKTTVIMMVSAFCGKDLLFRAYEHALKNDYKFLSYGDSMLII